MKKLSKVEVNKKLKRLSGWKMVKGRNAVTGIPDNIPDLAWKRVVLEEMDITGVRANPNCGDEVISLIENKRIQNERAVGWSNYVGKKS